MSCIPTVKVDYSVINGRVVHSFSLNRYSKNIIIKLRPRTFDRFCTFFCPLLICAFWRNPRRFTLKIFLFFVLSNFVNDSHIFTKIVQTNENAQVCKSSFICTILIHPDVQKITLSWSCFYPVIFGMFHAARPES